MINKPFNSSTRLHTNIFRTSSSQGSRRVSTCQVLLYEIHSITYCLFYSYENFSSIGAVVTEIWANMWRKIQFWKLDKVFQMTKNSRKISHNSKSTDLNELKFSSVLDFGLRYRLRYGERWKDQPVHTSQPKTLETKDRSSYLLRMLGLQETKPFSSFFQRFQKRI